MLAAYRDKPGDHSHASRVAGCKRTTAKKGWEVGWPLSGLKAIRDVIEEGREEELLREKAKQKAIADETEAFAAALRGEVRNNALEEYERTNQYVRAAAMTATAALVAAHRLQPVVQELGAMAPMLVEKVHAEVMEGSLNGKEAMRLLQQIAEFTKTVGMVASTATIQGAKVVEVTRARSGDVLKIKEAVVNEPFDSTEAKRLAAELAEAVLEVEAQAEEGPALVVVSGKDALPPH